MEFDPTYFPPPPPPFLNSWVAPEKNNQNVVCFIFITTYQEILLFLCVLEASMTELAASINELELDLLQSSPLGVCHQRL